MRTFRQVGAWARRSVALIPRAWSPSPLPRQAPSRGEVHVWAFTLDVPADQIVDFERSLANEELSLKSLVNVPPSDPALRAKYPALVVPGDPQKSFLVRKLEGPTSGEGLRMPQGMPPLDAATIAAIKQWIVSLPR